MGAQTFFLLVVFLLFAISITKTSHEKNEAVSCNKPAGRAEESAF